MSGGLYSLPLAAVALLARAFARGPGKAAKRVSVTIDAGRTAPPISPYMHGQFTEHIGDLINRSLRAGMLDDRKFSSPAAWSGGLFTHCFDNIDVMSEHFCSCAGQRTDIESARRIPMAIGEWACSGAPANLRGNLAHAMVLQKMFRHTDLIKMAGHTMGTSSIDYDATEADLSTTVMLFKLYRDRFGTVPLQVDGDSPVPPPQFLAGSEAPKVLKIAPISISIYEFEKR